MGYTSAGQPNSFAPNTFAGENSNAAYNYTDQLNMNQTNSFAPNYPNQQTNQPYFDSYSNAVPQYGQPSQLPQQQPLQQSPAPNPIIFNPNPPVSPNNFGGQFSMLQQPIVQNMAIQYGQQMAEQGKDAVAKQIDKYVSMTRLKYYFAVDNNYVVKKLILLLFPFHHRVSYTIRIIELNLILE